MTATFWLPARADGDRWTASSGQEFVGRDVVYGKLGKVGKVERVTPVNAGRALRLHVRLSRKLVSPDRRKFELVK